jgi:predicted porin
VGKTLAFAFALAGLAGPAYAADLDPGNIKDPRPDTLTWNGITLYGTIDVSYGYQTHGAPTNGEFRQDAVYNIFSSRFANRPISALESQAMEQSNIGVIVEQPIAPGLLGVARLETSFDPLYGTINDGPKSLLQNAGIPLNRQTANGDSSRAGQAFNSSAYGGVASETYGTLTIGRHSSIQGDVFREFDPQEQSNAFSLLRWSSALAAAGVTESSNLDNSLKYRYQYGPVHAVAIYSTGGQDAGFFGPAYGASVGGSYTGFSIDAVYQRVNEGALVTANAATATSISTAPATFSTTTVRAQIADGESWSVQGKYSFDFGGGLKDEGPSANLTFYSGYEHITNFNSNPTKSKEFIGDTVAGGYVIGASSSSSFVTPRIMQLAWVGARYELASGWSFSGAYYHLGQNHFLGVTTAPLKGAPNQQAGNLAGATDDASFVIDYRFNKHFDVYAGVNYSTIDGGLASGFLANNDTSFVTGARLKF